MAVKQEQETTIGWCEDEKEVSVYSSSPLTWRKMERLGYKPYKEDKLKTGEMAGKWYKVPFERNGWNVIRVKRGGVSLSIPRPTKPASQAQKKARNKFKLAAEARSKSKLLV